MRSIVQYAAQSRDLDDAFMGPGSAAHHFMLRSVRGTIYLFLILFGLARDPLQQFLDLAVLLALAVGPFADHLLLVPHMRDQPLNGLGEVGHRRGGAAATAAFLQRRPQLRDGGLKFAAARGGAALAGIAAPRGGPPVFEVGIEPVLGLARLQIEKAEDQRTGEAEQR